MHPKLSFLRAVWSLVGPASVPILQRPVQPAASATPCASCHWWHLWPSQPANTTRLWGDCRARSPHLCHQPSSTTPRTKFASTAADDTCGDWTEK